MRALMGLIKDRHGTYYAQKKVPERLQHAVTRVLNSSKPKQVFLKRSLGTKVLKDANVRAKPVLSDFDRILREAEVLENSKPPVRTKLSTTEINRMAEYVYAKELGWDQRVREGGRDELKRMLDHARKEAKAGGEDPNEIQPWWRYEDLPEFGFSRRQLADTREQLQEELREMREALALSNVKAVQDQTADALDTFGINLDPESPSCLALGAAVLRAYVRALEDIGKRNDGHPIETPAAPRVPLSTPSTSGVTLREAFEGWIKVRSRPDDTVTEYRRAVELSERDHWCGGHFQGLSFIPTRRQRRSQARPRGL